MDKIPYIHIQGSSILSSIQRDKGCKKQGEGNMCLDLTALSILLKLRSYSSIICKPYISAESIYKALRKLGISQHYAKKISNYYESNPEIFSKFFPKSKTDSRAFTIKSLNKGGGERLVIYLGGDKKRDTMVTMKRVADARCAYAAEWSFKEIKEILKGYTVLAAVLYGVGPESPETAKTDSKNKKNSGATSEKVTEKQQSVRTIASKIDRCLTTVCRHKKLLEKHFDVKINKNIEWRHNLTHDRAFSLKEEIEAKDPKTTVSFFPYKDELRMRRFMAKIQSSDTFVMNGNLKPKFHPSARYESRQAILAETDTKKRIETMKRLKAQGILWKPKNRITDCIFGDIHNFNKEYKFPKEAKDFSGHKENMYYNVMEWLQCLLNDSKALSLDTPFTIYKDKDGKTAAVQVNGQCSSELSGMEKQFEFIPEQKLSIIFLKDGKAITRTGVSRNSHYELFGFDIEGLKPEGKEMDEWKKECFKEAKNRFKNFLSNVIGWCKQQVPGMETEWKTIHTQKEPVRPDNSLAAGDRKDEMRPTTFTYIKKSKDRAVDDMRRYAGITDEEHERYQDEIWLHYLKLSNNDLKKARTLMAKEHKFYEKVENRHLVGNLCVSLGFVEEAKKEYPSAYIYHMMTAILMSGVYRFVKSAMSYDEYQRQMKDIKQEKAVRKHKREENRKSNPKHQAEIALKKLERIKKLGLTRFIDANYAEEQLHIAIGQSYSVSTVGEYKELMKVITAIKNDINYTLKVFGKSVKKVKAGRKCSSTKTTDKERGKTMAETGF